MRSESCAWICCDGLKLGISQQYGPRISSLVFQDQPNLMAELPGPKSLEEWAVYGGHRVWAAPEDPVLSYFPDNKAPVIERVSSSRLKAWNEDASGIQRMIDLELLSGDRCRVINSVTNLGETARQMASWGITSFAPGGLGIMPFRLGGVSLTPDRNLKLWPYTDLNDVSVEEWHSCIKVDQTKVSQKLKLGTLHRDAWLAYQLNQVLFIKHSSFVVDQEYPDMGCNLEIYADQTLLELESLSPLHLLQKGESCQHTETWQLILLDEDVSLEVVLQKIQEFLVSCAHLEKWSQ
jgi:hypothetical protein